MILKYPKFGSTKPRSLSQLGGKEEAAIYDLIFNDVPLRLVAKKIGLSYQGVYIRALAYMLLWRKLKILSLSPEHVADLTEQNKET